MELLRITRQIHCKAVEQRATSIHRQYNRDWVTSYSRPPIDPYLTSPCYKILAAPLTPALSDCPLDSSFMSRPLSPRPPSNMRFVNPLSRHVDTVRSKSQRGGGGEKVRITIVPGGRVGGIGNESVPIQIGTVPVPSSGHFQCY